MSEPMSIRINDVDYVRADAQPDTKGDIKIAVLDRGFVYVGRCAIEGDWLTITNAMNIRKWGTTKGLGELVNGPLSGSVMDAVGTVKVPLRGVMHLIDVSQTKWKM